MFEYKPLGQGDSVMEYENIQTLRFSEKATEAKRFADQDQTFFDQGVLIDLQVLLGFENGENEFWILADIFLEHLPKKMADIKIAYESEDWDTLHRFFHDLKSSSAYLGGKYLSRLAEVLGRAITDSGFGSCQNDHFPAMLAELIQECDRLKQHLESRQVN